MKKGHPKMFFFLFQEKQYVAYRFVSHPEKEWVRPVEDFLSKVNREKYPDVQQKYRFACI